MVYRCIRSLPPMKAFYRMCYLQSRDNYHKDLKPATSLLGIQHQASRSQTTYKDLKHIPNLIGRAAVGGSQTTYKDLKLYQRNKDVHGAVSSQTIYEDLRLSALPELPHASVGSGSMCARRQDKHLRRGLRWQRRVTTGRRRWCSSRVTSTTPISLPRRAP